MTSGYTQCKCSTCFDVTVSSDMAKPELCSLCEEAGCAGTGDCLRGDDDEDAHGGYADEYMNRVRG